MLISECWSQSLSKRPQPPPGPAEAPAHAAGWAVRSPPAILPRRPGRRHAAGRPPGPVPVHPTWPAGCGRDRSRSNPPRNGALGAMNTEGAGLEGLALVIARWVSPKSLRLNVLDHDRVDELPLTVVGAEPARHIPAASTGVLGTAGPGIICTRSAPPRSPQDKLWRPGSVQGEGKVLALLGQLTPAPSSLHMPPRAPSTQTGAGSKGNCIHPRAPCNTKGPEPLTGLALAVRPQSCAGAGRLG